METVLRIVPSIAIAAANLWLVWLLLETISSSGAGSAQADFEFSYYLFGVGIPVIVVSLIVVAGTFLSMEAAANKWRFFWATNAAIPVILGAITYA